ncbi:exodeoxyribonuclease VII small subunit [Legionella quinlivanii]|uniref:Exodeoxyribonuclease 7 small subunit n=1 Tax=Legionella quinlivanii TaxID=45073 RepID=A0A0W0Y439_9GAMM|nr:MULTISPECIES: exodeoxyribonuclease VII small subunit [Legionella]KTD51414.1 exodeoxyribonuclease VII small subunit [Legionella quinlivanii]MCE3045807.1 exodeoxyribonuclease VII small subunit [Legionella sp. 16cNR16C]MCW8451604.1 exodeoxyribonuclease VII small subunit [Legionella quinlivanii]SEG11433.1 Exodeoxyribonuclease VII small subunit [Legionella quinlivanii DSM 21216]STY10174.1 exodeoxyribonuclease VII small subunit [Legionella quinlivanii]
MSETIHFEKSMQELEEIVRQLERGDLMLEDSLKQYEKGIQLARKCQEVLTQAEQKIEMLRMNTMETGEPSNE